MLDSAKTGLAVRNRVKREDFAKYKKHVVEWKRLENEEYVASQDRAAGPFIVSAANTLMAKRALAPSRYEVHWSDVGIIAHSELTSRWTSSES